MNGKDLFLGLNYVSSQFIQEAETVTELQSKGKRLSLRKGLLIAAIVALIAVTVTACAVAISRIRLNYVRHNIPAQTETVAADPSETQDYAPNVLTDCYPQELPEGYEILCGNPGGYTSRTIHYRNNYGNSIEFWISTTPTDDAMALRPPVEESTVMISSGEAVLRTNDGAQVLQWQDSAIGYYANLFTDDVGVDLQLVAQSVGYGDSIPLSVWYHEGQEWNPWYPQTLPEGYACMDVSPVSQFGQTYTFVNDRDGYIRFGISTEGTLMPETVREGACWEDRKVNGESAKLLSDQSTQRTLFWENKEEGFYAFLETMDETIDLTALAESVAPGESMEVSKSYLGPDYTLEMEQDQTTYAAWQSVYPQEIPNGYSLASVGDKAYGEQHIAWENEDGDAIEYALYYRLGQYGRQFDGMGEPEIVDIRGNIGYRTGSRLLWTDEALGYAYELQASGDVDLISIAKSVDLGPELPISNDTTNRALEQLGDYRITQFPEKMVEDGLSGAPLEGADDWYSYVRRWYYNTENNHQIFFTYETYITDLTNVEDTLRLNISGNGEPELVTIHGCPGIALQDGNRAKIVWLQGDAAKGVNFQLYSEHFTVEELIAAAESVQQFQ